MSEQTLSTLVTRDIARVARAIRHGGVVAYPTEGVFGLGCDPSDVSACMRLLALKQRAREQGVLLIGASMAHILPWVDKRSVSEVIWRKVQASWPGPHTWIFPKAENAPDWITGTHAGIALRVTAHEPAAQLCEAFGGAIVSTSANVHGQTAAMSVAAVTQYFPMGLAAILDAPLGGRNRPSSITDALSGRVVRA